MVFSPLILVLAFRSEMIARRPFVHRSKIQGNWSVKTLDSYDTFSSTPRSMYEKYTRVLDNCRTRRNVIEVRIQHRSGDPMKVETMAHKKNPRTRGGPRFPEQPYYNEVRLLPLLLIGSEITNTHTKKKPSGWKMYIWWRYLGGGIFRVSPLRLKHTYNKIGPLLFGGCLVST